MANEFQFSFSGKEMEKLIKEGCERIIITGKVVYDPEKGTSTFEIYAESNESGTMFKIIGCPMPC